MDEINKIEKEIYELQKQVSYKKTMIKNIQDKCKHNWVLQSSLCMRDNGELDYKCCLCGKLK